MWSIKRSFYLWIIVVNLKNKKSWKLHCHRWLSVQLDIKDWKCPIQFILAFQIPISTNRFAIYWNGFVIHKVLKTESFVKFHWYYFYNHVNRFVLLCKPCKEKYVSSNSLERLVQSLQWLLSIMGALPTGSKPFQKVIHILLLKYGTKAWFVMACELWSDKTVLYEHKHLLCKWRDFSRLEVKRTTFHFVFFWYHSIAISLTFYDLKVAHLLSQTLSHPLSGL